MALRVLLADESSTIKKVFQLALQDFAVELRTVNIGVDVLAVASKFNPDIIFADVLLQKRSGYDVCADLKTSNELKAVPVVLMWSGFMELDEDKYQACRANAHLEKPFDVSQLRSLVEEFVPKTKTQPISQFLKMPKMPEFIDHHKATDTPAAAKPSVKRAPPSEVPEGLELDVGAFRSQQTDGEEDTGSLPEGLLDLAGPEAPEPPKNSSVGGDWNMDSFESISKFVSKETPDEETQWKQKDLSRYRVSVDPNADGDSQDELPISIVEPVDEVERAPLMPSDDFVIKKMDGKENARDEITLDVEEEPVTPISINRTAVNINTEEVIRREAKEMIEAVVWKVVPELAAEIIRKELERLLAERDQKSL